MKYQFNEGESQDLLVTIDSEKENNVYNVAFRLEFENISYTRTVQLKNKEITDLLNTFSSFQNGNIKDFLLWDLNTSAFEVFFNPYSGSVEFRLFLDPPYTHMSGLFFHMTGNKEYGPFISFLEDLLKSI